MKFSKALEILEVGIPMTRACWQDNEFIKVENGSIIKYFPDGRRLPIVLSSLELLVDDWEKLRVKQKEPGSG